MKHFFNFFAACAVVAVTLSSCKEEIDINKIDPTATVDLGIALPIGNITASLSDFLGIDVIQPYIEIDKDHVIHLKHDTVIERNFRHVDIREYPADTLKKCNMAEGFKVSEIWPGDQYVVEYPIDVKFDNVNDDPTDERIDSVSVLHAQYSSRITISQDMLNQGFKWAWINRIDVIMKDAFYRQGGNTITVYDKKRNTNITDFGQPIDIDLDNFMLYFMKDRKVNSGIDPTNILNSAELVIKYYVSIPWTAKKMQIKNTSTIFYNLHLEMLQFDAAWGYAKPGKDMRDEQSLVIEDSWAMWKDIKKATLPLAEPQIDLDIKTKVAGKFQLNARYFYAVADERPTDSVFASFNGKRSLTEFWRDEDEYIELDRHTIGDSISHHLIFNKEADKGAIHNLFAIRPDRVGYKFDVEVYDPLTPKTYPQIRLSPVNRFDVDAHIDLPLVFNKGLAIQYADSIKDIDLSKASLDSLLNGALSSKDVQEANLVLYLDITNRIPLGLSASVTFLDENNDTIRVNGKPIQLIKLGDDPTTAFVDTLNLKMPDVEEMIRPSKNDYVYVAKKDQTPETYMIDIDRDNFEAFAKTKTIAFNILLHNANDNANYPVAITDNATMKIHAGVTARINGKIDIRKYLNNEKENENQNK